MSSEKSPGFDIDITARGESPRAWTDARGNLNEFRYRVMVACNNMSIPELRHVALLADRIEDARAPAQVVPLRTSRPTVVGQPE